jgi:hypothetical protein
MRAPTSTQRAILELLTEFAYLTTPQIWQYLPTSTGEQAQRNLLARLQRRSWIAGARLYPEQGAASIRYWTLTPAGAGALGNPYTAPAVTDGASVRRSLIVPAPARPVGVGPQQARILTTLAEWKQLTTTQIWHYLAPAQPRASIQKVLWKLQRRHLVRGVATEPQQGGASEYYWMLLEAGAKALGIAYHQQYRRRPSMTTLEHRGLLLALLSAGAQAGWELLRPTSMEAARQMEQHLIAAVLARDGGALPEPGRVGAIVPSTIPDWVAYVPGQPARTMLLIPHPPSATRAFWRHQQTPTTQAPRRRPARLALYARLAAWVPVVGVFTTADAGQAYAPLLRQVGFGWVAVSDLAALLTHYAACGNLPHL